LSAILCVFLLITWFSVVKLKMRQRIVYTAQIYDTICRYYYYYYYCRYYCRLARWTVCYFFI